MGKTWEQLGRLDVVCCFLALDPSAHGTFGGDFISHCPDSIQRHDHGYHVQDY